MTQISIGGKEFLSAKQKCNISLVFDTNQNVFYGEVQGYDNNYLVLKLATASAKVIGAKSFNFQPGTQTLHLDFDKPKPFKIELMMEQR